MDGHLRRRRIMQRMGSVDKIKKLSNRYCSYGVLLEIVNAIYVVIIIPCTILLSSTLTKMLVIGITVVIGIFGFILGYLLEMYGDYLSSIANCNFLYTKNKSIVKMKSSAFWAIYDTSPKNWAFKNNIPYYCELISDGLCKRYDVLVVYFGFMDYIRYAKIFKIRKKHQVDQINTENALKMLHTIQRDIQAAQRQAHKDIQSACNDINDLLERMK